MARVGTWNLAGLFSVDDEGGPGSQDEYEAKVAAIAGAVDGLGVDVLAVQEVGSTAAFDDLAARLDGSWTYSLADPDDHGARVGFLARAPMRDPEQFTDHAPRLPGVVVDDEGTTTGTLSRPGLRVTVELDGVDVQLVVCHFASKAHPADPDDEDHRARRAAYAVARRAAEAATTRVLADQLLRGEGRRLPLVVLGDLGDTEHSATTSILQGPAGGEIGTDDHGRDDDGDGWRLWNLGLALAADHRHSRVSHGRRELVDHIFVSHALLAGRGEVTAHDVAEAATASDHRPVVADLDPTTVPAAGPDEPAESAGSSEPTGSTEGSEDDSARSDDTAGSDDTDRTEGDSSAATGGTTGETSPSDDAGSDRREETSRSEEAAGSTDGGAGEHTDDTRGADEDGAEGEVAGDDDAGAGRSSRPGLVDRARSLFDRSR